MTHYNTIKKLLVCLMFMLSIPFVAVQASSSFVMEETNQSDQYVTITGRDSIMDTIRMPMVQR